MTAIEIIFDEVKNQKEAQIQAIRSGKRKIEQIIALDALIATAAIQSANPKLTENFARIGILFLLGGIFWGLLHYQPQKYSYDPQPKVLYKKYLNQKPTRIKEQLIANWADNFEKNKLKIQKLNRRLKQIFWVSFIGISFLIIQVLF